jgi:diguanylate cyclase (GGDEF)-like protein
MMAKKTYRFGFTPLEHRISALPSTIASIVVLAITMFNGVVLWPHSQPKIIILFAIGLLGILYIAFFDLWIIPLPNYNQINSWVNAVLTALVLGIITFAVPDQLDIYVGVLLILAVITSSIISERSPSYLLIFLATVLTMGIRHDYINNLTEWTFHLSIAVIAGIVVETVRQLKNLSREHIRRLEIITDFSRNITSTLNTKQLMTLLNAAVQNAVEADTYFVGIRDGEEMKLELVYDDGEYFENQRVNLEGSLSSWVFNNHQSLFLPDLRKEVELPGIRVVLMGKHKTSLSWIGVPMKSEKVDGLISIGSYKPNAFDRADLELLSNLAQHATQALHNTYQHEEVERQSEMDSLTGVYNHGNFLKLLKQQADQAAIDRQPLALIMLDVDYFKLYNDSYGHLIGDEVLTTLCATIKLHIKNVDAVGRWGGEEFVISLANASADQAQQIALRIRDTMSTLTVHNKEDKPIPVPTVSQGIAIFPDETNDIIKLIDLADQRLYIAKERGRNQIEPDLTKLEKLTVDQNLE